MGAVVDWLAGAWMALAALFGATAAPVTWQGYVEADYLRVGLPESGTLEQLAVRRGQTVAAGDLLFVLDATAERAARDAAAAQLEEAVARHADLAKGERPQEIAALEAEKRQAEASLALSAAELARQQRLFDSGTVPESRLDAARSAWRRDKARVAEITARIASAGLGGRSDALAAAAAEIEAARAALAQTEWRLAQRAAAAPGAALVEDTLYVAGEHVAAGRPVVTLLPPGNRFVRFFVPETDLGRIAIGDPLSVTCDGCAGPIDARVSFISPEAEYTPPVIYSERRREKLVFMIEARPVDPGVALHPGQPVSVRAAAAEPSR